MSARSTGTPTTASVRALAESLSRELDAVRSLANAVAQERSAVEQADAGALRRAAELVRDRMRTLSDLSRERERSVVGLGLPSGSGMDAVASHLRAAGVDGGAVERVGAVLRREAAEVMRSVAIVRSAAERLAAHLAGLRSLVHAPAGATYGRRGRVSAPDRPLAVDVRH